jgi:hypothetical protein
MKERPEEMIVGGKHLKSVNFDIEADWVMITNDDVEVALMAIDNFRMNTRMVDTVPLIIWLV